MRKLRGTEVAPPASNHPGPITSGSGRQSPEPAKSPKEPTERGSDSLDEEDFQAICAVQGFSRDETEWVRHRLRGIIPAFGHRTMARTKARQKRSITHAEQIKLIRRQIAQIEKTRAYRIGIDRDTLGASRREVLAGLRRLLGLEVISCLPPVVTELARRRESRRNWEAANGFSIVVSEDDERRAVAADYCAKLREEFERCEIEGLKRLIEWLRNSAGKGGSDGNIFRARLIDELADLYMDLGRNPTPTKKGRFVSFVAGVLDAIGLPTDGVEDAVGRRLPEWRMWREVRLEKLRHSWDVPPDDWPDERGYNDDYDYDE